VAESEPEGSREEGGERRSEGGEGGEGTKRGNRFARDARKGERKGKPLKPSDKLNSVNVQQFIKAK